MSISPASEDHEVPEEGEGGGRDIIVGKNEGKEEKSSSGSHSSHSKSLSEGGREKDRKERDHKDSSRSKGEGGRDIDDQNKIERDLREKLLKDRSTSSSNWANVGFAIDRSGKRVNVPVVVREQERDSRRPDRAEKGSIRDGEGRREREEVKNFCS